MSKVLVISGTHGNETNAVQDVYDLKLKYEEQNIHDVIFCQAWNTPALNAGTREFVKHSNELPDDMNRAFPTAQIVDKDESINILKNLIKYADIVIDVHNSEFLKNCVVINNDCRARHYVDFCKKNHIPFIVIESTTNTIKRFALNEDKVSFTVEIGDMNFSDSNEGVDFLDKLIKALQTTDLETLRNPNEVPLDASQVVKTVYAHSQGLLRIFKDDDHSEKPKRSEILRHYLKGERIFIIENPIKLAYRSEEVVAPCDGYVMDLVDSYWVDDGDVILSFQPDLED